MHPLQRLLINFGHSLGLPSKYTFLRRLGAGAEGEVWLAIDEEAQGFVAVKLIPRGAPAWQLDMAAREFRTLAMLGAGPAHVNIARPLELVLTSKHLALITEYVPGGSLADFMSSHRVNEDLARYFFRQVLAAIAFCHSRRVVYRDVKPANALVTTTNPPFIKLCDFGLADSWEGRAAPLFNSLVGTPGYMSPEIMASFFEGAEALARRSQEHAAAAAAATAAAGAPAGPAAAAAAKDGEDAGGGQPKMVRSSSSQALTRAASGLAGKIAAAAQAATALSMPSLASTAAAAGASNAAGVAAAAAAAGTNAVLESEDLEVTSYDGQAADVFSLGVLLVVMLLRRMPWGYDAYAASMPALAAMRRLHHTAVTQRVSWQRATPGSGRLPPALLALLDGMLQPDPAKRATLQQVAAHEWVMQPLPPKLECALAVLQEEQQLREAAAAAAAAADAGASAGPAGASSCGSGGASASGRDAEMAAMLAQVQAMVAAAKKVGKGFKLECRIVLARAGAHRRQQHPQPQQQQQQQQQQRAQADRACEGLHEDACIASITAPGALADKAAPSALPGVAVGAA